MIPNLLWRCPLCKTIGALRHEGRWIGEEKVWCSQCQKVWKVIRCIGENTFYLYLLSSDHPDGGKYLPISFWYQEMKSDFIPVFLEERPPILQENEHLYLKSISVKLVAQKDNPLFFKKKDTQKLKKLVYPYMGTVGKGVLFLTNHRLIWVGRKKDFSLWFSDIDSVYIEVFHYLGISSSNRIYKFKLKNDSYLKWLTYLAYLAPQMSEHRISFSNY